MKREYTLGCYTEDYPWEIVENEEFERDTKSQDINTTCKHAVLVSENVPQFRNDGSVYGHHTTHRVPRVVRAFNEAGHSCTNVCLDCILEAASALETEGGK